MQGAMTILALVLAASLPAQSPLVTQYTSNGGGPAGGQVLFDLTVRATVTVTRLDVNTGSAIGTRGSIEVYTTPTTWVGNEQNASAWTLAGSGPAVAAGLDRPTPACIPAGIVLPSGSYGIAVRYVGLSYRRTSGNGSNQVYSTAEMTLTAGATQNTPWTATFVPRVFNGAIHYLSGPATGPFGCALASSYGQGCGGLVLGTGSPPLLGTTVLLQTTGIPAGAVVNAQVLSFTRHDPGIDLGPLGAPGCLQSVGLDSTVLATGTGTWSRSLTLPGGTAFLGLPVYAQSASLVPGINPLGVITSNGVELQLGNA